MSDHHQHTSDLDPDLAERFSQTTWDARYAESDRLWSGNPNPRLVEHVADLSPGDALDVGAGEGADVVWLASQGWQVTALDVSEVALTRTAAHAAEAGLGDRVSTLHHDLMSGAVLPGSYDLVSAQFMHPPLDRFVEIQRLLGAAVRPGGTLLVVGHHPADLSTGLRSGHGHAELLFTADKVAAALDPDRWEIKVVAAPTRAVAGPDGPITVTDAVMVAVRI